MDVTKRTLLHHAVSSQGMFNLGNGLDLIRYIVNLKQKVDVDVNAEKEEVLFQRIDVNQQDQLGKTALHYAWLNYDSNEKCKPPNIPGIRFLKEQGAIYEKNESCLEVLRKCLAELTKLANNGSQLAKRKQTLFANLYNFAEEFAGLLEPNVILREWSKEYRKENPGSWPLRDLLALSPKKLRFHQSSEDFEIEKVLKIFVGEENQSVIKEVVKTEENHEKLNDKSHQSDKSIKK